MVDFLFFVLRPQLPDVESSDVIVGIRVFLQDKGYLSWARTAVANVEKARSFMEECEAEATRAGASAPAWLEPVYTQAVKDT